MSDKPTAAVSRDTPVDDGDTPGAASLTMGLFLTTIVVSAAILGAGVGVEVYALVGTVLTIGGTLRLAEVLNQ